MDYRLVDAMVEAGELPTLARIYREGATGRVNVRATGLPSESPRIWTSYATGRLPRDHGIVGFVFTDETGTRRLYSSQQRRVPAVWEMFSQAGRRVGVVNWWGTYPAESVAGFVVSDRYGDIWAKRAAEFFRAELERDSARAFHPPALRGVLEAVEAGGGAGAGWGIEAAEATDREVFELARTAQAVMPVDVLLVYIRALDELSHLHWGTHEVYPEEAEPERDVIAEYMRVCDRFVGELMERMDAGDHLVVLSDHGFERRARDSKRPKGGHESADTAWGVLLLHGPRIEPGQRLEDADVLDVLPTILDLADVPADPTLAGQSLRSAFRSGFRSPLERVAAYQRMRAHDVPTTRSAADEEIIERLKALGYMREDEEADAR